MYVIMYREAQQEFEVTECGEGQYSNYAYTPQVYEDKSLAEELAICMNNWNMKGTAEIKKCKQCGLYFFVGRAESYWFEKKGLEQPKRCETCRKNKEKIDKPKKVSCGYYLRNHFDRHWEEVPKDEFNEYLLLNCTVESTTTKEG